MWNEPLLSACLEGEVLRALGYAAFPGPKEEWDGSISPAGLAQVPSILDLPPIHIHFVGMDARSLKPWDQLPFLAIAPAYVAAASQATGLHLNRMPLTAEVMQKCLEA